MKNRLTGKNEATPDIWLWAAAVSGLLAAGLALAGMGTGGWLRATLLVLAVIAIAATGAGFGIWNAARKQPLTGGEHAPGSHADH